MSRWVRTKSESKLIGFCSEGFSRQKQNCWSPTPDYEPSMGLPSCSQFCQQQWWIFPFCSISSFTEGLEYAESVTGCSSGISYFIWDPISIKQMKTDLLNIQINWNKWPRLWNDISVLQKWKSSELQGTRENNNNLKPFSLFWSNSLTNSLQRYLFIIEILP